MRIGKEKDLMLMILHHVNVNCNVMITACEDDIRNGMEETFIQLPSILVRKRKYLILITILNIFI